VKKQELEQLSVGRLHNAYTSTNIRPIRILKDEIKWTYSMDEGIEKFIRNLKVIKGAKMYCKRQCGRLTAK
jgi:hypothetical protein